MDKSVKGFWNKYVSKLDQSDLIALPFFHNTKMSSFEEIEINQWVLNAEIKDEFHKDKKIFFFYGNPVYVKKEWDHPIVLGVKFKNLKKPESICPTDTGLIMQLVKNNRVKQSDRGRDYYYHHFTQDVYEEQFIPTINKYLTDWFGNIENYCSGRLMENPKYETKDCHINHYKFVNLNLQDFFKKKELEKHKFAFDKRRRTVELAFGGNVNLPVFSEVAFIGIPNNPTDKTMKESIMAQLRILNNEVEQRIYEYDIFDENSNGVSLEDIMSDCIKHYHQLYNIETKGLAL